VGIHRRSLTPIVVLRDGISVTIDWGGSKPVISPAVNTPPAGAGLPDLQVKERKRTKRKGLQLALEPLNGQGIAGYVPEPEFWARR
jgi:hypothetical protein